MAKREQPLEHLAVRSDLFEVKPSSDKGLGVFAVENIPVGTRLISDNPVMIISGEDVTDDDVYQAWVRLPSEQRAQFFDLSRGESSKSSRDGAPWSSKLLDIYNNNRFEHNGKDDTSDCICLTASRLNHSCVPNAEHIWNFESGQYEVYSIFDIAKGEEITIAYMAAFRAMPRTTRHSFMKAWGFTCSCKSCICGDEECNVDSASCFDDEMIVSQYSRQYPYPVSDLRRLLINRLYTALTKEEFPRTSFSFFRRDTTWLRKSLVSAQKPFGWLLLTQLMEAEQLRGSCLAHAYYKAGKLIHKQARVRARPGQALNAAAVHNANALLWESLKLTNSFRPIDHIERAEILDRIIILGKEPVRRGLKTTDDPYSSIFPSNYTAKTFDALLGEKRRGPASQTSSKQRLEANPFKPMLFMSHMLCHFMFDLKRIREQLGIP